MLNMKPHRIPPAVYFAILEAAGLKSADIARKLDVTRAAVSQWRSGVSKMDDRNYAALVDLALSSESRFLMRHHTAQQPDGIASPELGTLLLMHNRDRPVDYLQWMTRSFQAQLGALQQLVSGDRATWDYEAVRACSEDIASMARALAVIMADREEKEACRVITPTADAAK